jgi:hypothetical protein
MLEVCLQKWVKFEGLVKLSQKKKKKEEVDFQEVHSTLFCFLLEMSNVRYGKNVSRYYSFTNC